MPFALSQASGAWADSNPRNPLILRRVHMAARFQAQVDLMKAGKMTQRAAQKRAPRNHRLSVAVETDLANEADPGADTVVVPFLPASESKAMSLTLAADCTARNAAGLKALLLTGLGHPEPLRIEAAAVERVDTVCLQLLAALVRDRKREGRAVVWSGDSEVLAQAASLLGLTAALELRAAR